ncbi:MAG: CBS domain-containing protein [Brucellaceae bacterium]|nr:CBS domain-containing protein [Brucellaceae bacterium]
MTVKAILDSKGREVATISPTMGMMDAVRTLGEKRIGAIVVTDASGKILGILSERDVVKFLAADGPRALDIKVADAMTRNVKTCTESNTINEVMEIMTQGRFRHLPVEVDGKLGGIISIGDVVKRRIEDVEREADEIRNYIAAG